MTEPSELRTILEDGILRHPDYASAHVVLAGAADRHGLDVGAVEYMTQQLRDAAARGVAVLLISTELEEILSLSHRIAVILDVVYNHTAERGEGAFVRRARLSEARPGAPSCCNPLRVRRIPCAAGDSTTPDRAALARWSL